VEKLKLFGNHIVTPAYGELASGLTGEGRMEEPENILHLLQNFFADDKILAGKKVLVSAGPTYENIDPVRFIGNRSSGKMGFALAEAFAMQGADVTLVTGPSALVMKNPSVQRINVQSAAEMYDACLNQAEGKDIIVMAAAVADYKPVSQATEKIKKENNSISISLTATGDILAELGRRKQNGQVLVGFALETTDGLEAAKGKLQMKNLDLVVLNSLQQKGAGFDHDTNQIKIIDRTMHVKEFEMKTKTEVAADITHAIVEQLNRSQASG
jgi:phosphopantothenoylcysteine decarboxylase/phosphopantothenate--cysteine ligase